MAELIVELGILIIGHFEDPIFHAKRISKIVARVMALDLGLPPRRSLPLNSGIQPSLPGRSCIRDLKSMDASAKSQRRHNQAFGHGRGTMVSSGNRSVAWSVSPWNGIRASFRSRPSRHAAGREQIRSQTWSLGLLTLLKGTAVTPDGCLEKTTVVIQSRYA